MIIGVNTLYMICHFFKLFAVVGNELLINHIATALALAVLCSALTVSRLCAHSPHSTRTACSTVQAFNHILHSLFYVVHSLTVLY